MEQEMVEGARWRAGEIEEEGRTKIGTPTTNNDNDNDDEALFGFEGRLEGATIVPITIPVRPLPRPPLPAPPKSNIRLPRALQLFQPPKVRVSPIFWVGEHESDARQASRCPSRRAAAPNPDLHPIPPILTPTAYPPPQGPHHPVFDIGEYSGEVRSPLRSLCRCENGTDAYPPIFPIPPTSRPRRQHRDCPFGPTGPPPSR